MKGAATHYELATLHAAVLDRPSDDLRRLVLADWLEEYGGEADARWAELVRAQCELARRKADGREQAECSWGGTCACRSHELRRREAVLLDVGVHHNVPVGPPPAGWWWSYGGLAGLAGMLDGMIGWHWVVPAGRPFGSPLTARPWFSRGFADRVRAPWRLLWGHHRALWESHPIETVDVADRTPEDRLGWGARWCWRHFASADCSIPHRIPLAWWRLLPCYDTATHGVCSAGSGYESKEAAQNALSAAIVRWATRLRRRRWKARRARAARKAR